jgi:hypothetical protein
MTEQPSVLPESMPIAVRLVDVPDAHVERCRRLARERGWYLLEPQDSASPDVVITREGGVRSVPTPRGRSNWARARRRSGWSRPAKRCRRRGAPR